MPTASLTALLPLLVHPVTKAALTPEGASGELVDAASGDRFPVRDGLPILLPPAAEISEAMQHYEDHYQRDAEEYDYFSAPEGANEREESIRLHQYILREIPAAAATVLDVGCGGGWLAGALLPKGKSVISMDISDSNPRRVLQEHPHERHSGLVANALYMPIAANSVDCIVASEIIEHVPDPTPFVHALYETLKPGGKLIITTPYNELIRYSLCIHCNRNTPHNAHLHSFTKRSIRRHVPAAAASVRTEVMSAKALSILRAFSLLSWMPLSLFSALDGAAIWLTRGKANRLMLTLEKATV